MEALAALRPKIVVFPQSTDRSAGEAPDFHFFAEENKLARNVDFFPRLRNGLQPGTDDAHAVYSVNAHDTIIAAVTHEKQLLPIPSPIMVPAVVVRNTDGGTNGSYVPCPYNVSEPLYATACASGETFADQRQEQVAELISTLRAHGMRTDVYLYRLAQARWKLIMQRRAGAEERSVNVNEYSSNFASNTGVVAASGVGKADVIDADTAVGPRTDITFELNAAASASDLPD